MMIHFLLLIFSMLFLTLSAFSEEAKYANGSENFVAFDIAEYNYHLGTSCCLKKDYKQAEIYLSETLRINPGHADARLRLGYLCLWQGDNEGAIIGFERVLQDCPNYQDAKEGLEKAKRNRLLAKYAAFKEGRVSCAKCLEKEGKLDEAFSAWYFLCINCPGDAECLFNAGKVASWIGYWNLAETLLKEIMKDPDYKDCSLLRLGYLYLLLEEWPKAYASFLQLSQETPEDADAWLALGRLDYKTRRFCLAKQAYCKALQLAADQDARAIALREYNETMFLQDPSVRLTERYGQETERDLQSNLESARRYAWQNEVRFQWSLAQRWVIYQQLGGGYEREKNLVAGVDNFNANTYLAITGLDYYCNANYKFTGGVAVKAGVNRGSSIYEFKNSVRLEPWCGVDFRRLSHHAALNYCRDSFIYKNFADLFSAFLTRDTLEGVYEYQFLPLSRYIGVSGYYRSYQDSIHNDEGRGRIWAQMAFPKYKDHLVFRYQFELGGFRRTDTDYYSFKRQWEHIAKVYYWQSWSWLDYAELSYQHSWRSSRDLSQPINTPFIIEKQFINTNTVSTQIRRVFRKGLDCSLDGLYYWDTAGYRAFAIKADLRWLF